MPIIRSISGLRATVGDSLTPQLVVEYASAFSKLVPNGKIIIGIDGRPSGRWIESILAGTIVACGHTPVLLGLVPTPVVQLFVEHTDAVAGIIITASHNPKEWNGLKFLNKNGVFLNQKENERLWDILDKKDFTFSNDVISPKIQYEYDNELYFNQFKKLKIIDDSVLLKIRKRNLKVVVDAVNASGSEVIPKILQYFNCEVIKLFCDKSGIFPHTPEPIPANLTELEKAVKEHKADFGIAVDPDADRLVLVNENGEFIGEERTITLACYSALKDYDGSKTKFSKSIVANYSTTRAIDDVAKMFKAQVFRSPVGEINVVGKMKETNALIGGEGSGGVIFPDYHYGRDPIAGISLIIKLFSDDKKLSEIDNLIPKYDIVKIKLDLKDNLETIYDKIEIEFKEDNIVRDDGIRIDTNDAWVQLRPSNTEPIIRIIAEAKTLQEANILIERVKKLL